MLRVIVERVLMVAVGALLLGVAMANIVTPELVRTVEALHRVAEVLK